MIALETIKRAPDPALLLLLCMSFALLACGSGEAASLNACALLSKTDVEAVLGEKIEDPQPRANTPGTSESAAISNCSYKTVGRPAKRVSLMVRLSPVEDNTPEAIKRTRDTVTGAVDVKDVGDVAFWGNKQLTVFKGKNRLLIVGVTGIADDAVAMGKAKALAQKALKLF